MRSTPDIRSIVPFGAGRAVSRRDIYERVERGEDPTRIGWIYWLSPEQVVAIAADERGREKKRAIAAHRSRQRRYRWWKVSEFLPGLRHA